MKLATTFALIALLVSAHASAALDEKCVKERIENAKQRLGNATDNGITRFSIMGNLNDLADGSRKAREGLTETAREQTQNGCVSKAITSLNYIINQQNTFNDAMSALEQIKGELDGVVSQCAVAPAKAATVPASKTTKKPPTKAD